MRRFVWLLSLVLAVCVPVSAEPVATLKVREPAVAGLFYPREPAALAAAVDAYVAAARTTRSGELRALICPHAGYPFSGPVAGMGFHLLQGLSFKTVYVLGPAHYAALNRASVSGADVFRTPLGDVPISAKAKLLAAKPPFALDPPCEVERPEWARQASRPLPASRAERADTWEHADEVEVPFLQRTLTGFELVPVVMGDIDAEAAARALAPLLDDSSLLVVSSDLSHYHPYAEAQRLDRRTVDAICSLNPRAMADQEACGRMAILTLLHLARSRGWKPQLLDLRNSGDTAGDKSSVVGYTAIAFYGPPATAATPAANTLTRAERKFLLDLARRSVADAANRRPSTAPPATELSPALTRRSGVFVTLTKRGELRGCIGHIVALLPLAQAVIDNARSAAVRDTRFPRVTPDEVRDLDIEISVLSEPQPLAFTSPDDLLRKLRPNVDGVVLRTVAGAATYLPQVWEQLPDKREFLDSLAEKAGGQAGDWRRPDASVSTYTVESFREDDR